ncbi:hypothetical protein CLHUN_40430 [Ruminiclostridium hungatei]|uniref:ABC-2 family transporter protein n=1 Tax=Ruminiclostridium hungatei TaxID=48256 RepID=A0A1V4SF45_RUMHU|nr:ABC-2 transporter permease [Ruminiclostridium hungatei]OPX42136.1 hypothetical protein CLHUN_40430 [Ruminiclostridium hungatei]
MNNVLKMLRLDISLIKPYSKSLLVVFIAPLIIIYSTQDIVSGFIFCMSIMAMTSNYTFSIAEKNDLNRLYGLLPVSKKDIVAGRYLFSALAGLIAVIFGSVMDITFFFLAKRSFEMEEVIVSVSAGLTMYMLFTAVQLPAFFKFGAIKGRFISFIPFLGIFLVGIMAKGLKPETMEKLSSIAVLNNTTALFVSSILLDIVLYGISMGIAQRIYDRMEF